MMRLVRYVALILLVPQTLFAQGTSEFTIRVFGSDDLIPPSTPTLLSVVPVASSQIDLTWSTSTDNYSVFGYVVFRDGTPIATTTALSYSDTGLTASTTYLYEVAAFDGVPNYSATSTAVPTTTPDIIVPPAEEEPPSSSISGTIARTVLDSLSISVGVATATINLATRQLSRIEVRLGTTQSYELAYIVGNTYKTSHQVFINDLLPGTTYYYELIGYTPSGSQTVLERSSFTTLSDRAPLPPTNVSNLTAEQQGESVRLTFTLPPDFPANGQVRVVRNRFGFPQFLSDGQVVYEGTSERVLDVDAFLTATQVFYTVFVIDPNGLVSSGAVVRVVDSRARNIDSTSQPLLTRPGQSTVSNSQPVEPTTEEQPPLENPATSISGFPALRDFFIEQGGQTFSFASSSILLTSDDPFTIYVPAEYVQGDFKTMVATLADPRGNQKTFSFLLRLNGDRTSYNAVIAPLRVGGVSDLLVEIFDFDTKVVAEYETTLTFSAPDTATSTVAAWYWQLRAWLWGALLVVPLLTLALIWFIFWRRDEDEDEDNGRT